MIMILGKVFKSVNHLSSIGGRMSWPVTKSIHLFDNVKLKAEWFDISKALSRSITNIDTSVLLGGRLDYSVTYTQGWPLVETANIYFESSVFSERIVTASLSKGQTKVGAVDLTGFIGNAFDVKINFYSAPGIWSEIQFDIWVTLGFSEPPATDPHEPFDLWEWIKENPILAGAIGIGGMYILFSPRARS